MSFYPVGKLPSTDLVKLLEQVSPSDPQVILGGSIGEDAAVIDLGDRYLVAKSDPITFATDEVGWYAVNVNANDVACMGATPRWFLATLLLPEKKSTPELVNTIFKQIRAACDQLNISLVGGHTEITYGLDRPLVIGQMLGEVSSDRLITSSGAQIGDDIILTKGIAVEATAIIATELRSQLLEHFNQQELDGYANFLRDPGISVVRDAMVAISAGGVHVLHDPTEGGVATGLHELAQAAAVGLTIEAGQLPYLPETLALCRLLGLDPLGLIASGALLIVADPKFSVKIIDDLAQAGIKAGLIGRIETPEKGCMLQDERGVSPLPRFERDEITRLFEQAS